MTKNKRKTHGCFQFQDLSSNFLKKKQKQVPFFLEKNKFPLFFWGGPSMFSQQKYHPFNWFLWNPGASRFFFLNDVLLKPKDLTQQWFTLQLCPLVKDGKR